MRSLRVVFALAFAVVAVACNKKTEEKPSGGAGLTDPSKLTETAPATYKAKFTTTQGDFVVAECLPTASRYGQACDVVNTVAREDGHLHREVADDGVGGADPARGTGLLGLADRLEVLGGGLEIHSPPGEGTRIRAHEPRAA